MLNRMTPCLSAVLFLLLAAPTASASIFGHCKLKIQVLEIDETTRKKSPKLMPIQLKVLKVLSQGGISRALCKNFTNRQPFRVTLQSPSEALARTVRKNVTLTVQYHFSEGMFPDGPRSRRSWTLLEDPKTP